MKAFVYKGKYNGDENSLPAREHPDGAVPFKEAEDMKKLSIMMNAVSILLLILSFVLIMLRNKKVLSGYGFLGFILSFLCMVPHEFLHGICFKGTVYMYQNLAQGMLFVVSTEEISKARFIFMSLLPNLVFGFLPLCVYLIYPQFTVLGTLGALSISMGAGGLL